MTQLTCGTSTTTDLVTVLNSISDTSYSAVPPSGFTVPTELATIVARRDGDKYSCNLRPNDLLDISTYTNYLYVDVDDGSNGGAATSWATAERRIANAIDLAIVAAVPTRIFVKGGIYKRERSICGFTASKTLTAPISIEGVYGRVVNGIFDDLTYTKTGGQNYVYQATRSSVLNVLDMQRSDEDGNLILLDTATSIADCDANPNSWYTDNITVYIHSADSGIVSDATHRSLMSSKGAALYGDYDIYLSNIDMYGGNTGALDIRNGSTNTVVINNCRMNYALSGSFASPVAKNGAAILDCGLFAAFDSKSSVNSADGFNFHINNSVLPTALTVNCKGFGNGFRVSSTVSNNGITMHDGGTLIDIGGTWLKSKGTNAGHVSADTEVWHFGSLAGMSDGDIIAGGSITWGAFGAWSGAASVWLDSCTDIGAKTGVYEDGTALAKVARHTGDGAHTAGVTTYDPEA